jgi:DNA polymerase III alpha subunit (gram-positive type)
LINKNISSLNIFLNNFGIFNGDIKVIDDFSAFNYENFNKRNNDLSDPIIDMTIPALRPDFRLINPTKITDDISNAYFEGTVFSQISRKTKTGKTIFEFSLVKDFKTMSCIIWVNDGETVPNIKKNDYVRSYGYVK